MRKKFSDLHIGSTSCGISVEIKDCHSAMGEFLNRARSKPVEPIICIYGFEHAGFGWAHIEAHDVDSLCRLLKEAKKKCEETS